MKVLITGAGGMLGTELSECLAGKCDVEGCGLYDAEHLNISYFKCDLTDFVSSGEIIRSKKPEVIIHLAALTDVDYCEEHHDEAFLHNYEVVKNLIDVCNKVDSRLIFLSTDYVFSGEKTGEYAEADKTDPINFYGKTKLLAEQAITAEAKKANIFRITWLYGEYGKCFPAAILKQAAKASDLRVVNDQFGRPNSATDIASFLAELILKKKELLRKFNGEVFHIGNEGSANWADFAEEVLSCAGLSDIKIERISSNQLTRLAARPKNSVLSLEKARSALGMKLPNWRDAVGRYVKDITRDGLYEKK